MNIIDILFYIFSFAVPLLGPRLVRTLWLCYSLRCTTYIWSRKQILTYLWRLTMLLLFIRFDKMVQMGTKTTTITEVDILQQEINLLKNIRKEEENTCTKQCSQPSTSKQEIIWTNVVFITFLHILAVVGFYSYISTTKMQTIIWGKFRWWLILTDMFNY